MNGSVCLRYSSLMLAGLLAGSSLAFILGMGPALQVLSMNAYIELHLSMDSSFNTWAPFIYCLLLFQIFLMLWQQRRAWREAEFILMVFALLCVFDEVFIVWKGNLPLSRTISSWQAMSPPSNWDEVREQWMHFMYLRSALLFTSFGLLLASSFLMKNKTLASRQDVAVVA